LRSLQAPGNQGVNIRGNWLTSLTGDGPERGVRTKGKLTSKKGETQSHRKSRQSSSNHDETLNRRPADKI